jgi:hypothetical protein
MGQTLSEPVVEKVSTPQRHCDCQPSLNMFLSGSNSGDTCRPVAEHCITFLDGPHGSLGVVLCFSV